MRRGLTLVEVLIAGFVLVAASLPVLVMIYTGSRESSESENAMFAAMLAQSTLERKLSAGYKELVKAAPESYALEGIPAGDSGAAEHREFAAKFAGSLAFRTDVKTFVVRDGLVGVEAIVRWGKVSGKGEHRFAATRLLAKPDLSIEARPDISGGAE